MRIALKEDLARLVTLDAGGVHLFDISGPSPHTLADVPLAHGQWLAGCDPFVGVLSGKLDQARTSISKAVLHRLSWADLASLGSVSLGLVERRGLSFSADGTRLVTSDGGDVLLKDAATGATLGKNGEGIPSGAALSPDGTKILAGAADQGSGDILLLDALPQEGGRLPMQSLPPPKRCPGLDDAPYFGVFSATGRLAALSNETWGGRGIMVFDIARKKALWGDVQEASAEEPEDWYPYALAFSPDEALLFARHPDALEAYRVADGKSLGRMSLPGNGQHGFAIAFLTRRVWVLDDASAPTSFELPAPWLSGKRLE